MGIEVVWERKTDVSSGEVTPVGQQRSSTLIDEVVKRMKQEDEAGKKKSMYFVSYDLSQDGKQDYKDLYKKLRELDKGATMATESTWWLSSSLTTEQVLAYLRKATDCPDKLCVIEAKDWEGKNCKLPPDTSKPVK